MKRNTAKRIFSMLIIATVCITQLAFGSFAVSVDKTGSITLTAVGGEDRIPVIGVVCRLYPFASAQADGDSISFSYTDDFSENGMDMGDFSDTYLPIHLAAFAEINSVAYAEKVTDNEGRLIFDNLVCGAYLVVPVGIDDAYLTPAPFIVCIPMTDEAQNKWIYDIDATPKIEIDATTQEKTYISVKKQWENTDSIPESITVALVRDGVSVETVVLNAENNWYYKWEKLDVKHSWNVVEVNVPQGYEVSYDVSQMTVIITNTLQQEETTEPEETTLPDETTTGDELIDTGQLNWPVPTFAIAGLLIFSAGWLLLNSDKKDEKTV